LPGAVDMVRKQPRELIEGGGNEPPDGSVAGMIAYLEGRGVELKLARGRLVARSRTPIRAELRELIEHADELLVGPGREAGHLLRMRRAGRHRRLPASADVSGSLPVVEQGTCPGALLGRGRRPRRAPNTPTQAEMSERA